MTIKVGDRVAVTRNPGSWLNQATWWPADGVTGDVTRVCKNGSVYVAQDWLRNNSEDGKRTRVFTKRDNVTIAVI